MRSKIEQIFRLANLVSKKYQLVPPVDFSVFEDKEICIIKYEDNPLFEGYVMFDEMPPVITISNSEEYKPRINFTLAHEIGHIMIPWHDGVTTCSPENAFYLFQNKIDIQELEANVFAMELLMPREWVKSIISKNIKSSIKFSIEEISRIAKTSMMATLFAVKNSLGSGNSFFVSSEYWEYSKKFICKETLTSRVRGYDVEELCKTCYISKENFTIGSYIIHYYKLEKCPSEIEIQNVFDSCEDIEGTLYKLSNGRIISLLHCLDIIVERININYYLVLYKNGKSYGTYKKRNSAINISYGIDYKEAIDEVKNRFDNYKVIDLEENFILLCIQEPIFEALCIVGVEIESRLLLREILDEIYHEDDSKNNLKKINGLIGYANGSYMQNDYNGLFTRLRNRIENNNNLEDFIKHKNYEMFLSLKCSELIAKKNQQFIVI